MIIYLKREEYDFINKLITENLFTSKNLVLDVNAIDADYDAVLEIKSVLSNYLKTIQNEKTLINSLYHKFASIINNFDNL